MTLLLLMAPMLDEFWIEVLQPLFDSPKIVIVGACVQQHVKTSLLSRLRHELRRGRGGYVLVMALKTLLRSSKGRRPTADVLRAHGITVREVDDLYSEQTLAFIRAQRPDLLFRNGFGIIREPVLSLAPKGVISFHHGDIRRYRGQPVAFWELHDGEPRMGVTVQVLSDKLDGGKIVVERSVPILPRDSWRTLEQRAYAVSTPLIDEACRLLADPAFTPTTVPADELGALYTTPNLRQWLRAQGRIAARRGRQAFVGAREPRTDSAEPAS